MPILYSRILRRGLLATALTLPIVLAAVLVNAQDARKKERPGQTARPKFKNIRVLKSLPPDQLIPVMRGYNAALGVKCDFCHVVNANHTGFDRDDKPMKQKARAMIVLVKDLNGKYKTIDHRATCAMCHHGHAEPETGMPDAPR